MGSRRELHQFAVRPLVGRHGFYGIGLIKTKYIESQSATRLAVLFEKMLFLAWVTLDLGHIVESLRPISLRFRRVYLGLV